MYTLTTPALHGRPRSPSPRYLTLVSMVVSR